MRLECLSLGGLILSRLEIKRHSEDGGILKPISVVLLFPLALGCPEASCILAGGRIAIHACHFLACVWTIEVKLHGRF
jgi:hypothetical protein